MTQAGWYPDPAGQPQTFRYWDGTSWSEQTTGDPYAPPPAPPAPPPPPPPPPPTPPPTPSPSYGQVPPTYGAVAPPPPGGYGQSAPLGGGFPPSPSTGGRGPGVVIALVVGAVLLLVGLSVAGFVGYRALAGDDDDSDAGGVDSTSATDTGPTEPAPTDPTTGTTDVAPPTDTGSTEPTGPTEQQCRGGLPTPSVTPREDADRVSGGGLSIPVPSGYTADVSYATYFTFAENFTPLQKTIEQSDNLGWVSIYGVGGLRKANGFTDPAQAAEAVMACMAGSPDLYNHFTGREDLSSGLLRINGVEAFQITSELRVDDPDLTVEGDVAQVIVLDTGDAETFGLYISVVPIGDDELIAQQEAAVGLIEAD